MNLDRYKPGLFLLLRGVGSGARARWWIVLLFLLLSQYPSVKAQGDILVVSDGADLFFPYFIRFRLTAAAAADAKITSVNLRYGTNGRNCQNNGAIHTFEVEPRKQLFLTWDWSLADTGVLPPDTEYWWEWEIVDDAGQRLVTERQTQTVVDLRHNFETISRDGVTLRWIEGDLDFGRQLHTLSVTSLGYLAESLGVTITDEIFVTVYPDAAAVRGTIINVPEWTGGVAFPRYNSTVIGVAADDYIWANSVIPHELTHLVIGTLVFNCRGITLPVWLNEGLAVYGEGPVEEADVAGLYRALENGTVPSLRSLADGFSAFGNRASMAYTQSGEVVHFLVNTYGSDQLRQLLTTVQGGQTIDTALLTVYGFDTDGLDSAWRIANNAQPLPTRIVSEQVATVVPTLAPFTVGLPATVTPTATATAIPTTTPRPSTTPTQAVAIAQPTATTATALTPVAEPTSSEAGSRVPVIVGVVLGILLLLVITFIFILRRPRPSTLK